MKAKELAAILLQTPDAEVVHYQYTGGDTPLRKINTVKHESEGEQTESHDGGDFIGKGNIAKVDIVILTNTQ